MLSSLRTGYAAPKSITTLKSLSRTFWKASIFLYARICDLNNYPELCKTGLIYSKLKNALFNYIFVPNSINQDMEVLSMSSPKSMWHVAIIATLAIFSTGISNAHAQSKIDFTLEGFVRIKTPVIRSRTVLLRQRRTSVRYIRRSRTRTVFVPRKVRQLRPVNRSRTLFRRTGRTRTVYLKRRIRTSRTVAVRRTHTRYIPVREHRIVRYKTQVLN